MVVYLGIKAYLPFQVIRCRKQIPGLPLASDHGQGHPVESCVLGSERGVQSVWFELQDKVGVGCAREAKPHWLAAVSLSYCWSGFMGEGHYSGHMNRICNRGTATKKVQCWFGLCWCRNMKVNVETWLWRALKLRDNSCTSFVLIEVKVIFSST